MVCRGVSTLRRLSVGVVGAGGCGWVGGDVLSGQ